MDWNLRAKLPVAASLAIVMMLSSGVLAQEPEGEAQQKPAAEEKAPAAAANQSDVELRAAIKALADEVHNLSTEVRRLRHATEQSADAMQLVLYEDRLARVEDDINTATARKAELDLSEATLNYRKGNIQQELIYRGGLNREDSEAAIRAEIQRSLQDVHAQQGANDKRLMDLRNEESMLRMRIRQLRKKLHLDEGGANQQREY